MHQPKSQLVTAKDVWKTWYPLALSWLMMGIELPLLSAVVARLKNPEVNLGAYGGVVFPLAFAFLTAAASGPPPLLLC